jgi:hypothetical protein
MLHWAQLALSAPRLISVAGTKGTGWDMETPFKIDIEDRRRPRHRNPYLQEGLARNRHDTAEAASRRGQSADIVAPV